MGLTAGASLRAHEFEDLVDGLDDRYAERADRRGDARDGEQGAVPLLRLDVRLGAECRQRVVEGVGAGRRDLGAQLLDQGEELAEASWRAEGSSWTGVTRLSMPTLPEPPCMVTWSPPPK
ncbi:hypothetical protein [Streptomyces sp. 8N706]|uniref:hypothetical protein n=1 Tax=Streptomyces sp. 8N706 TaxID=3457416 RepID=UPI003FD4954A